MIEELLVYERSKSTYKKMRESISQEIINSPFKTEYLIKETGISPATFYRKLKSNSFTSSEIIKILSIIKPQEINDYFFRASLERGLNDIKEGRVIDHKEMEKYINEINESL